MLGRASGLKNSSAEVRRSFEVESARVEYGLCSRKHRTEPTAVTSGFTCTGALTGDRGIFCVSTCL